MPKSWSMRVMEVLLDVRSADSVDNVRVINASVPDLSPSDIIGSPDLKANPSFIQNYRAQPLVGGRQSQPSNF